MKFWDSSALGSLLLDEVHSAEARTLFAADPDIAIWWCTPVECLSVIWGSVRRGRLPGDSAMRAEERLNGLRGFWTEIQPAEELRTRAASVIRIHDLKAADAFQLAAALYTREHLGGAGSLDFICFDQRLSQAALREGFRPHWGHPQK